MRRERFAINLTFFVVTFLTWTVPGTAQDKFSIALKINEDLEQSSGQVIASGRNGSKLTYSIPAGKGLGQAPGGILVRIARVNNPLLAYQIWVDSDGNGDVANERAQVVMPNSSIIVKVNRRWVNGRQETLPYTIMYSREPDQNGQIRQGFMWIPHYRAEGRLKTKSCEALFTVLDLNSDGQFDSEDFFRGTSIGLDRNSDESIWGKDEYLKGEQIIEYCGEAFLIDRVAVDGTSITFATTALRVPIVGEHVPAFLLTTVDGKTIDSRSLRNKVHLLDFWASWCKPCVEKFSVVKRLSKEFKDDVSIIAVNVDEAPRLPMARQIIRDYRLPWPHVMTGRGEADSVWKIFGAIGGNRLGIPLYVLVDAEGRLRYAGSGGEDLSDLRVEIKDLLEKKQ